MPRVCLESQFDDHEDVCTLEKKLFFVSALHLNSRQYIISSPSIMVAKKQKTTSLAWYQGDFVERLVPE